MSPRLPVLALAGLFFLAPSLQAQTEWFPPPRAAVGLDFLVGDPVGRFADYTDESYGADFFGRVPLDPAGVLSLRADLGFLVYGHESWWVCLDGVGCRIRPRLQTSNNIFFGGIGPELAIPTPWARPYVNAQVGFGYFNTFSSLEGDWDDEDYFRTENFSDGTLAWSLGWGLELNVHRGRVPVALNFGARYHRNGVMEYLTEGDIVDNPDGSITLYPNVSEANLISYRFGITVGIPSGDDGRNRRDRRGRRH